MKQRGIKKLLAPIAGAGAMVVAVAGGFALATVGSDQEPEKVEQVDLANEATTPDPTPTPTAEPELPEGPTNQGEPKPAKKKAADTEPAAPQEPVAPATMEAPAQQQQQEAPVTTNETEPEPAPAPKPKAQETQQSVPETQAPQPQVPPTLGPPELPEGPTNQ